MRGWAMGSLGALEGDVVFDGRSERLGVVVVGAGEDARIARAVGEVKVSAAERAC